MRLMIRISVLVLVVSVGATPCFAKMYKYKKDGVWYYTDAPPREMLQQSEALPESESSVPEPSPEGTPLLANHPARNAIEKAAAATVAVKGGLGYGSGFFVSTNGYILTNKHVIRTTGDQAKEEKEFFGAVEGGIKEMDDQFAEEKQKLDDYAAKLDELKRMAEKETDTSRKTSYEKEYAFRLKEYKDALADYEKRRRQYESEKKDYRSRRTDYEYTKAVANLSQSFEIILADNTRLNVRLVKISANHDLALLKLDGYKTPALKPSDEAFLIPGFPLYAVGNPAKLRNTVTKGVFSGFERGFIKTNAQIYPGNSGGPLVTVDGNVAGINTFKHLTRKYEGLGFAIPIDRAFSEFGAYLRR